MNKHIYPFLLIMSTLTWASCKGEHQDSEMESLATIEEETICITEKQMTSSGYEIGKLSQHMFSKRLSVNGKIHVPEKNRAKVVSYIGGKVSGFDLIDGQKIKRGQYLFSLTGPEILNLQDDYLTAKSKLDYLEYEMERQQKLSAENLTTQKEIAKTEESIRSTKSALATLQRKLGLMGLKTEALSAEHMSNSISIYSPINGVVTGVSIIQGGFLNAGETALELIDSDHMHLELSVLEKDGSKLAVGQHVRFTTPNMPDTPVDAEIYLIDRKVDQNRLISVHCHFEDDLNVNLFPDMFASADILIGEHTGWSAPESAIVREENTTRLLVLQSDENNSYCFEEVVVKTGLEQDGRYEIIDLDKAIVEKEILLKGAYYITD